jgi:hypothetical protein
VIETVAPPSIEVVPPGTFVGAMSRHWSQTLKNVVSPELQETWAQMAHVFNRQIEQHGTPEGERWKVLQPATGTGKSQGLAVFCSLLPEVEHPGVLVVVRLKVQADELAQTVNTLTGQEDALAYHTDHKVPLSKLATYPVLVITHRAYEIGLDAVNKGQQDASNWSHFHTWGLTGRRLLVIDEALDILEEAQNRATEGQGRSRHHPLARRDEVPEADGSAGLRRRPTHADGARQSGAEGKRTTGLRAGAVVE